MALKTFRSIFYVSKSLQRQAFLSKPEGIQFRPIFKMARDFSSKSSCPPMTTRRESSIQFNILRMNDNLVSFGHRSFTAVSRSEGANVPDDNNGNGSFYFDTHQSVTTLQSRGFTLEQSEAITSALTKVVGRGAAALSKYMVSRNELAQLEIRMNATVEALRKDMVILEKSEFLMLKHENDSLKAEVAQLSRLLKDELLKLRSGLTLDLSLEKGRSKEESSIHEQKIKDAHNRIETEIAKVRMDMEAQKLDLIKYLVGCFLSILTVLIGWWRFVKS